MNHDENILFTTRAAAVYLDISMSYLINMRNLELNHDGPKYHKAKHKHGIACYYKKSDLDAWSHNHKWKEDKRSSRELLLDKTYVLDLLKKQEPWMTDLENRYKKKE